MIAGPANFIVVERTSSNIDTAMCVAIKVRVDGGSSRTSRQKTRPDSAHNASGLLLFPKGV